MYLYAKKGAFFMKRTKLFKQTALFLFALCAVFCLQAATAHAATAKMATAENGKSVYYPVQGTIYRMNTKTGKTKKIKEIANTNWVRDISYYKGYLYFTVDYFYYLKGTDGTQTYICRMKKDGTEFKKLAVGDSSCIYKGKLYYRSGKLSQDASGVFSTDCIGISRMTLTGKSKKRLVSGNINSLYIVGGKLYYTTATPGSTSASLYCVSTSGKSKKLLRSGVESMVSDGSSIYYCLSKEVRRINGANRKDSRLFGTDWITSQYEAGVICRTNLLSARNGVVYFTNNSTTLKKYTVKTKKTATLKTGRYFSDLYVGSGNYAAARANTDDTDQQYSEGVARITKSGKKFKFLKKYFRP